MDWFNDRKGQVTIFIILGMVLLVIGIFFLYLKDSLVADSFTDDVEPINIDALKFSIEVCLENVLEDAIIDVSQKGGYYNLPNLSTTNAYINTAYYLVEEDMFFPSSKIIQDSISEYILDNFYNCINFSTLPNLNVSVSKMTVETFLTNNSVKANLNLPLVISGKDNSQIELNNFESTINSRVLTLFDIAKEVSENQREYGDMVCISCLALLGSEFGLDILTVDGDEGTLFSIFDLESDLKNSEGDDLSFRFIHKYYDETVSGEICEDSKVNIDFIRLENFGYGDATNEVYVGSYADKYFEGEEIILDEIDGGVITNVPGLALERGPGYLHFVLHGSQTSEDLEIVDFVINSSGIIFTTIKNDDGNPLENFDDGGYSDDAVQDEVFINSGYNSLNGYLRVSSANDGFYVYYDCINNYNTDLIEGVV